MNHHHLNAHLLTDGARQGSTGLRSFRPATETENFGHMHRFALVQSNGYIVIDLELADDF
ncbi:MAG: hypothetical protein EBY81_05175 [Verrucomicrobia bacterium]|nr:hypothetical protein [Verrucomicrobiota bacterium]